MALEIHTEEQQRYYIAGMKAVMDIVTEGCCSCPMRPRERCTLKLEPDGCSTWDIANEIEIHIKRILKKKL